MPRIMFVCHGNICRSPMAEFIMKDLTKNDSNFHIASSATSREEIGNSIYSPAKKILNMHHITYTNHYARQLEASDYDKYDYIIIMDTNNEYNIKRIIKSDPEHKIRKLLSFIGSDTDVSDPWYTNEFEKCFQDIYKGCVGLLDYLNKKGR
ncbi:MAG: low molecular weight protein-tyrosine-phosphatase [Bacilli bacterium]|nr:low molecular weight phosphotyrosine protein phosphatase [Mollicutes bacterium]MDY3899169.1 low molecular weight protein-tyrosine-phosphatase [Bacilli bacterium]